MFGQCGYDLATIVISLNCLCFRFIKNLPCLGNPAKDLLCCQTLPPRPQYR